MKSSETKSSKNKRVPKISDGKSIMEKKLETFGLNKPEKRTDNNSREISA